ncbi:MAG TPA: hypothetical protein VFZ53_17060 [Polyangiaceae bacterium]
MQRSFFQSLGPVEYFALALAASLTVLFVFVHRRAYALPALALAAFLPVPAVALFSKQFDLVGWHGFMQASPMYQIMERGVTWPEDPLYAGAELRYPWVEYWLMAKASLLTGLNPLVLSLVTEAFAYAALLAAVGFIGSKLSRDPLVTGLSILFGGFGISIFHSGLLAEPLMRAFPPLWLESRVIPLDKFLNVTAAPIGYAAMAVSAAAVVELLTSEPRERKVLGVVAVSTLVAGLFHPLSWLGLLVYQGSAVLLLLLRRARAESLRAGRLLAAFGVPSVLCFPYLRALGTTESSDGWMGVTDSWTLFNAKLADLVFFLATFALFAYLGRVELVRRVRARDPVVLLAAIVIGSLSLAYLVVRMAGRNEYKFLIELVPGAAPVLALALREQLRRTPVAVVVVLFLLLVPGGMTLGHRPWFEVTDKARVEGRHHRALDPVADELYSWVAKNTPPDAVFLAVDLRVPPFGRRSLYVAVDAPWRGRDGWGLMRNQILQWHVRRPDREMYRRQHLATIVLNGDWAAPAPETMASIQRDVPGRPLFVHAWYPALAAKFDATPGFRRRFTNGAGAIFSYSAVNRGSAPATPPPS